VSEPAKIALVILLISVAPIPAGSASLPSPPHEVSICDVKRNPQSFDRRLITLRGFVNLEFEDFTLHSEKCDKWPQIWLMFGGDVPTPTMSTAGDTKRTPGRDLVVDGIAYPLVKDSDFRKFVSLITSRSSERRVYPKPGYKTVATLTGTFFAGHPMKNAAGETFGAGYGHMGCCYLFIIKEISAVESIPSVRAELRGSVVSSRRSPVAGVVAISEMPSSNLRLRQQTKSDDAGHFKFLYPGQMISLRHPDFRPVDLLLKPGESDVHVVLENANESDWLIPTCISGEGKKAQIGRDFMVRLPASADVSEKQDGDSLVETITLRNGAAKGEERLQRLFPTIDLISIVSNAKVDSAPFLDLYQYREPGKERWMKDGSGKPIGVDARGQSDLLPPKELSVVRNMTGVDGPVHWRSTVLFGQGMARYFASPELAPLFDEITDSACREARPLR
jgi:hypothetical protein